jgi:hypothetical protein
MTMAKVTFDVPPGNYVVLPIDDLNRIASHIPDDVTVDIHAASFRAGAPELITISPIVFGKDVEFDLAGNVVDIDDD